MREVTSVLSWASCVFKTIASDQSAANPDLVIDMRAYGVLILREVSKHGDNGWSAYDALFCQHAYSSLPISVLGFFVTYIHASTFLVSHSGGGAIYAHFGLDLITPLKIARWVAFTQLQFQRLFLLTVQGVLICRVIQLSVVSAIHGPGANALMAKDCKLT